MSTMEAYPRLMHALDEVRGTWRRQKLLEGMLLVLAGAAAVVAALVAIDNLFQPGIFGRAVLAAVLWGALLAALMSLVVRRWLEDRRDDYFAALVEQKYPNLHNRLINALQLGRGSQRGFSPGLIAAIVSDADRASADLEMGEAIDARPTRRAALWAVAGVVVLAGYAVAWGPYFANGLARLLLPGADIPPYSRTQVPGDDVRPGNTRIGEGKPVQISARVTGVVPDSARLHVRREGGAWEKFDMTADPAHADKFSSVRTADQSFDYFISAGDGRSPTFRVEVVRPPRVESISVTIQEPKYTARKAVQSDGPVTGVVGTTAEVQVRPSKPLQKATLEIKDGETIELKKSDDEKTWGCTFVLWRNEAKALPEFAGKRRVIPRANPTTYRIALHDTEGYDAVHPVQPPISLTEERPPQVKLLTPGNGLELTPQQGLDLTVESRADAGLGEVRLLYRVNKQEPIRELHKFPHAGPPVTQFPDEYRWKLDGSGLAPGDEVEYWADAADRNDVLGPRTGESGHYTFRVIRSADAAAGLGMNLKDYAKVLAALLKLQRDNRAGTEQAAPFGPLVDRQALIRTKARELARVMDKDPLPLGPIVQALDRLAAGLMAEALTLLESGRDSAQAALAQQFRARSVPVQDKIIAELESLLARLQKGEEARKALRKIEKKDPVAYKKLNKEMAEMVQKLDQFSKELTELAGKFERLPKREPDAFKEEKLKALNDLEEKKKRAQEWAKGSVNEMAKMAPGFVDDFGLRPDINKIFEEVEKAAQRAKAQNMDVALEDLGAGLATKMKEDLEMWLPDTPDNARWLQEEPLNKKPQKIPEMPLPKALEDLIGELLQKADEFDQEADDITSAWADNLDQAGWGVSDGPISSFSAKGKTGNDLPNNMEVTGRSGDGRRGKSSGQMVGDTSKALEGRKTPARVGNERYEPGQLKQEGQDDPNGATGGGKKAGAGRKGLQGGTPPDQVPEIGRLSAKQAGLREKAEQVARQLDTVGVTSSRLNDSIQLMKSIEKDLSDKRYDDAFRKRKDALEKLRGAFSGLDRSTATQIKKAEHLPEQLKRDLLQSADEGYPAGYEGLLKSYYKALSTAEKK
jgi:hypothetical protein